MGRRGQPLTVKYHRPLTKRLRRGALCCAIAQGLAVMAGLSVAAPASYAQNVQQTKRYDIPAGPLTAALKQFGRDAGILLSFSTAQTGNRHSPGLHGDYGVAEGLQALLVGTGLEAVQQDNGGYTLREVSAPTLKAVKVQATEPFDDAYTTPSISVGGKTPQTLREIPQSVTVVTQQRIADQNLESVAEVLEQVAGVTAETGFFGVGQGRFYARGFQLKNTQIDGAGAATAINSEIFDPNLLAFERVEVLRGSNGLFAGNGEPSGVVNLVRKRAPEQTAVSVKLDGGSWNRYQGTVDAGAPLAFDGALRGRVVASYRDVESFIDNVDDRMSFIYTTAEADLSDSTLLIVGGSIEKRDGHAWSRGLPRYANGDDIGLSRSTSMATDWSTRESDISEYFVRLEQKLGGDWTWTVTGTRVKPETNYKVVASYGAVDPVTMTGHQRFNDWYDYDFRQTFWDTFVSGTFEIFGKSHDLVVGTDGQIGEQRGVTGGPPFPEGQYVPVDVFDPRANQPQKPAGGPLRPYTAEERQQGFYAKTRLSLTDTLKLILGGRYADYRYEDGWQHTEEDGIFTPFGGLTLDIGKHWTAYASVSDIYKSQADRLSGPLPGSSLDPIEGRSYEIGAKSSFYDERLTASFALYQIERTGEAMADPAYPVTDMGNGTNCCFLDDGEAESRGFETEIGGEPLPGLNVTAGYTYNRNKNKVTSIAYSTITPRHLFKLWTTWRLPGALSDWDVGGGVNVQSSRYVSGTVRSYNEEAGNWSGASLPFEFTQGGYALWSLRAGYRIDEHWSVSANVENVFDKTYYRSIGSTSNGNWYGEPRNVLLSVSGRW